MNYLQAQQLQLTIEDKEIIKPMSLGIGMGEFVGLIGANGAGKSTLLRLLMGLENASSGEVLINGKNINKYSRRDLSRLITIVPQDTSVNFPFTVRDLVAIGRHPYVKRFQNLSKQDWDLVDQAMEATEISHLADRSVVQLSGGERQRAFIARAIAQQTPVILLDEATANLDVCHQLEILQLARALANQNQLVIAAIHDLNMASRFCDRLLLLQHGQLQADGHPCHVLTTDLLRHSFNVDTAIHNNPCAPGLTITPLKSVVQN